MTAKSNSNNLTCLIIAEHYFEIRYFLEQYKWEEIKRNRLFSYKSNDTTWLLFCNNGDGFLALLYALSHLQLKYSFYLLINIGIAGSLDKTDDIGAIFSIDTVIYHELQATQTILPPLKVKLTFPGSKRLITVPFICEGDNVEWSYFGDLLDMEGYFIADWAIRERIPCLIVKQVSDHNLLVRKTIDPSITEKLALYFVDNHEKWEKLLTIEHYSEICTAMNIPFLYNENCDELAKLFKEKKTSFTERQNIYSQIREQYNGLIKNYLSGKRDEQHRDTMISAPGYLFIEKKYTNNGYEKYFNQYRSIIIESYNRYFSNKTDHSLKSIYIAEKKGECLKEKPHGYGNVSYDHLSLVNGYNCPFSCKYCYLDGYFKNNDIVIFINKEEMVRQVFSLPSNPKKKGTILYFGDFCDGLVYDHITGLSEYFSKHLNYDNRKMCEFRTKSTNIGHLKKIINKSVVIPAWTISPQVVIEKLEHGTADLEQRFHAILTVIEWGYTVSLHIDPVIVYENWLDDYKNLMYMIRENIHPKNVFFISIGLLRMNRDTYRKISKKPEKAFLCHNLDFHDGMYRYDKNNRDILISLFEELIISYYGKSKTYICME